MKWCNTICRTVRAVERGEKTVDEFNALVKQVIDDPSDTNDMELTTAAVLFATFEKTYTDQKHMTTLYRALHHGYIEHILAGLKEGAYNFPTTDDVRRWDDILTNSSEKTS